MLQSEAKYQLSTMEGCRVKVYLNRIYIPPKQSLTTLKPACSCVPIGELIVNTQHAIQGLTIFLVLK